MTDTEVWSEYNEQVRSLQAMEEYGILSFDQYIAILDKLYAKIDAYLRGE